MDDELETIELSSLSQSQLQDRLELIEGKMSEISLKIKNTSAVDPSFEYLTGKLEHLEEEKKEIEENLVG